MANIYAEIFYYRFKKTFLNEEHQSVNKPTHPKIVNFLQKFNQFLNPEKDPSRPSIDVKGYYIGGKEFSNYLLGLRATMIACAKKIPTITEKDTRAPELIRFFQEVKKFAIDNSSGLTEDFDYDLFTLDYNKQLLDLSDDVPNEKKTNVFFFDVNRLNFKNEDVVNKAFKHSTKDLFKEKMFQDSDVYMVSIPSCYPEEVAASTILETIEKPQTVNSFDRYFVEENWGHFVGKDIEYNEDGTINTGSPYTPEELKQNLKNLKIFSYCAGAANAHRCLNALKNIALQLYESDVVKDAWQNIDVVSYAFPLEANKIDYNCTSLMCNEKNPDNPEAVVLTNFPSHYRQHCLKPDTSEHIHIHDEKSCKYISLELPPLVPEFDHEGHAISRQINNRNGHRLQNITYDNPHSPNFKILCYMWYQLLHNKKINNNVLMNLSGQGLPGNTNQRD